MLQVQNNNLTHEKRAYSSSAYEILPDELLGYNFEGRRFKIMSRLPFIVSVFFIAAPFLALFAGYYKAFLHLLLIIVAYWFYRGVLFFYGTVMGFIRYKIALRIDWRKKLEQAFTKWKELPHQESLPDDFSDFYTVVLIPVYKEPYEVLHETVRAIVSSDFPKEKLTIVFALEERGGQEPLRAVKRLKQKFGGHIADFRYYVHPKDIPGEAVGIAGPNLRWASKHFLLDMQKERGLSPKSFFIIKIDADLKFTPQVLSALTAKYLFTPRRNRAFFSPAVILYANNIWDVPIFNRVFSYLLTLSSLSEWGVLRWWKRSFSTYAFSGQVLSDIGNWDPKIGVDDTGFFFQAYIRYHGDFRGEEVYLPVSMDAVEGVNYLQGVRNFFKQQYRWGGGAIIVPMTLTVFRRLKLNFMQRIDLLYNFFEIYTGWRAMNIYFVFYFPVLMLLFESLVYTNFTFVLSYYLSVIFRMGSLLSPFLLLFLHFLYRPYAPKDRYPGVIRYLITMLEVTVVFPINTFIFTTIPYLRAQLDLFRGRLGNYAVMPKYRKTERSSIQHHKYS